MRQKIEFLMLDTWQDCDPKEDPWPPGWDVLALSGEPPILGRVPQRHKCVIDGRDSYSSLLEVRKERCAS